MLGNIVIFGVVWFLNLIVAGLLYHRLYQIYNKNNIGITLTLGIFNISITLLFTIRFFGILFNLSDFQTYSTEILSVDSILINLILIIGGINLVIFYIYFENLELASVIGIIISVFLTIYVIDLILFFRFEDSNLLVTGRYMPFLIMIIILARSIQSTRLFSDELKKVSAMMILSLVLYYAIPAISILYVDLLMHQFSISFVFVYIIPGISVLFASLLFIRMLPKLYLYPSHIRKLYKLLVITEGGLPIYSYNFVPEFSLSTIDILFSGGLTALNEIFDETYGFKGLKKLVFEDYTILIEIGKTYSVYLFAETDTPYFKQSLGKFCYIFYDLYHDKVQKHPNNIILPKEGDKVILNSFSLFS